MKYYAWRIGVFFFGVALSRFLAGYIEAQAQADTPRIVVKGEVKNELSLSLDDLRALPPFFIPSVPVIPERVRDRKDEELVSQVNFRGVLLRDILLKAGMKHTRKWEPGVYIRIVGKNRQGPVFSFGEVFYSSIGRSILIAYERDQNPCPPTLVVATDIHDGRMTSDISEIHVARVDIELKAYEDKAKGLVRPPSSQFTLVDTLDGKQRIFRRSDLEKLPRVHVPAAVLIGDCEGFHGIHSLDGVPLAVLLEQHLRIPDPPPYHRYVVISSDDGYCATFSFGELFNSRLGNQTVIAIAKDGRPLPSSDGFAMSVNGEDSTGGRSVKRIHKIEVR